MMAAHRIMGHNWRVEHRTLQHVAQWICSREGDCYNKQDGRPQPPPGATTADAEGSISRVSDGCSHCVQARQTRLTSSCRPVSSSVIIV